VERVHAELRRQAAARGARFDEVMVCPHAPDAGCTCRKPLPGLLLEAASRFGYDLFRSYVVGDSRTDLLAGRAAGARPLLVRTGKGAREAEHARQPAHLTFPSLAEAVDWILSRPGEDG
jgi:D-glycero-D-manno-heptose 1,7-bisphosphate phosphatase